MKYRLSLLAFALILLAAPCYHVVDLSTLGGSGSGADSLNNLGWASGFSNIAGNRRLTLTIYDASRKLSYLTWVTHQGRVLAIEGRFERGEMTLNGVDRTAAGRERHVRGVWKPVEGGVRETSLLRLTAEKPGSPASISSSVRTNDASKEA